MKEPDEIKNRIFEAADELYLELNGQSFPTVPAVREKAGVDMNQACKHMREWRESKKGQNVPVIHDMPENIQNLAKKHMSAMWAESQKLTNESLRIATSGWDKERQEAEEIRIQLSNAFDECSSELDDKLARNVDLEKMLAESAEEKNVLKARCMLAEGKLADALQRLEKSESDRDTVRDELSSLKGQLTLTNQLKSPNRDLFGNPV
jgi:chromosome segregation ATPase